MNFTRPSDEAHATLDGFMGQDPAHQTSAPPPKEKNVRKKLDAATGEILQRRAGAKVQQGCKQYGLIMSAAIIRPPWSPH